MSSSRFGEEKPLARKKGPSGCAIIALVFAGLVVLVIIGVGVGIYRTLQNPEVKEAVSAMGSMMNAPGRKELQAAGCDVAVIVDMRAFANLAKKNPRNRPEDIAALENAVLINCMLAQKKPGLACENLAKVYRDAIAGQPNEAPAEVNVFVQVQGEPQPVCSGRFDSSGTYLGEAIAPQPQGGRPFPPTPSADPAPQKPPRFGTTPYGSP